MRKPREPTQSRHGTVPDGSQFDTGVLPPTALAFLSTILASGAIPVDDLQTKARAAGLLSARQRITDAKLFKRAKRTLGIKSVRFGFGAAGEWFWTMPAPSGSEVEGLASRASTEPSPAVINDVEPLSQDRIGVPSQWVNGIASLNRFRAPAGIVLHRWQLFISDAEQFLNSTAALATRAVALGWTASQLFGCAPVQPIAHLHLAGLIWALRGRAIVGLYPDCASIENSADGSRSIFNRRIVYGAPITLPWRLR
jgi:hypothetical protein